MLFLIGRQAESSIKSDREGWLVLGFAKPKCDCCCSEHLIFRKSQTILSAISQRGAHAVLASLKVSVEQNKKLSDSLPIVTSPRLKGGLPPLPLGLEHDSNDTETHAMGKGVQRRRAPKAGEPPALAHFEIEAADG